MDALHINEFPYHEGGRFGPGQEMYYAKQRVRLWQWYCNTTNTPFVFNETSIVYKKKKEVLQRLCESLGLPTDGKNKELIARLDRYDFTAEQLQTIESL
jgi:hypothetical protein